MKPRFILDQAPASSKCRVRLVGKAEVVVEGEDRLGPGYSPDELDDLGVVTQNDIVRVAVIDIISIVHNLNRRKYTWDLHGDPSGGFQLLFTVRA